MLKSFFCSKEWVPWAWGGLAFLLTAIVVEVQLQVLLNEWYRETWDLLGGAAGFSNPKQEGLDGLRQFYDNFATHFEILPNCFSANFSFGVIVLCGATLCFSLATGDDIFLFSILEKIAHEIEGASQRLQQDPERFARIVERLGLGLFRAILTLIAFIPILWNLSAELTESVNKKSIKFNETFIDLSKADESLLDSLFGDWTLSSVLKGL